MKMLGRTKTVVGWCRVDGDYGTGRKGKRLAQRRAKRVDTRLWKQEVAGG